MEEEEEEKEVKGGQEETTKIQIIHFQYAFVLNLFVVLSNDLEVFVPS